MSQRVKYLLSSRADEGLFTVNINIGSCIQKLNGQRWDRNRGLGLKISTRLAPTACKRKPQKGAGEEGTAMRPRERTELRESWELCINLAAFHAFPTLWLPDSRTDNVSLFLCVSAPLPFSGFCWVLRRQWQSQRHRDRDRYDWACWLVPAEA